MSDEYTSVSPRLQAADVANPLKHSFILANYPSYLISSDTTTLIIAELALLYFRTTFVIILNFKIRKGQVFILFSKRVVQHIWFFVINYSVNGLTI